MWLFTFEPHTYSFKIAAVKKYLTPYGTKLLLF